MDEAYDDVSGVQLDAKKVRKARMKEIGLLTKRKGVPKDQAGG